MRKDEDHKDQVIERRDKPDVSRRNFITKAAIGAGATAASMLGTAKVTAASEAPEVVRPIKIPDEFALAAKAPLKKADFPMTGAELFARVCKRGACGVILRCAVA